MNLQMFVDKAGILSADDLELDAEFEPQMRARLHLAALKASHVFSAPQVPVGQNTFAPTHKKEWARFIHSLAHWERIGQPVELPRKERVFVAAWHFPEVAALFAFAREIHALMLVSQDAPWLKALREAGCTLNFQEPGAVRQLIREMQAGRVVAAMLDHAIPGTRCEPAQLLGRIVSTPSGILELCSKHGYLIAFVAPRPEGIRIVAHMDATGQPARKLAQQYNDWLEAEIRTAPERWLMWQALPLR